MKGERIRVFVLDEAAVEGCCTECGGTGATREGPCWDCQGTGHPHLGPCEPEA